MIKSILIANRGEIACRVIRTCRKMGIRTIAVYSDADKFAPHVKLADTACYIGSSEVSASYLNVEKIIAAAKLSGADAVHPGYGFFSENENFAKRLAAENLIFIGPNVNAIAEMGNKNRAKAIAEQQQVPTIPGYRGEDQSAEKFKKEATLISYPILLKAAAGGGGKGMRIVHHEDEMEAALSAAKREAKNAFGDDEMLLEKYFPSARHIEIQIFGDKLGNVIYLLERECSIQRRYQKVIEESPSPVIDEQTRKAMGEAAVRLAKALQYDNAGTVEFIWSEGAFYFLEVNTRLQVEHPVTEAITGLDLVKMQIEVAAGLPLPLTQNEVKANGYALECRLYAEDAANDFLPTTGKVLTWQPALLEGLRYDSGIESGSEVSIYYDPMLAKIIAHGTNRAAAIQQMEYALRQLVCLGTITNHDFLIALLQYPLFISGKYDTHFLANNLDEINTAKNKAQMDMALIAATLSHWQIAEADRTLLQQVPAAWRNNFFQPQFVNFVVDKAHYSVKYIFDKTTFAITIGNDNYKAAIYAFSASKISILINEQLQHFSIAVAEKNYFIQHYLFPQIKLILQDRLPAKEKEAIKGGYSSPMPATVLRVLVQPGESVKIGQPLMILSSMKMENTILADGDGIVEEIFVAANQNIGADTILLKIKE